MLLDLQSTLISLLKIELEKVARLVATEQALNQDGRAIALKASLKAVNVDLEVEFVLFGARLIAIVRNVPLHVLI